MDQRPQPAIRDCFTAASRLFISAGLLQQVENLGQSETKLLLTFSHETLMKMVLEGLGARADDGGCGTEKGVMPESSSSDPHSALGTIEPFLRAGARSAWIGGLAQEFLF